MTKNEEKFQPLGSPIRKPSDPPKSDPVPGAEGVFRGADGKLYTDILGNKAAK